LLKRLYDLTGVILTMMVLNYAASPFILLTVKNLMWSWQRLGWYGHIVIIGSLLFFYAGGTAFFEQVQKEKVIGPPVRGKPVNGEAKLNGSTTSMSTLVSEKNLVLPPLVDKIVLGG
jgi:lysophospholipid acyltransferase